MKTFKVNFEITLNGDYCIEAESKSQAKEEAKGMIGDGYGFRDTELVDYEITDINIQ